MDLIKNLYVAILKLINTLLEMFGAKTDRFDEIFGEEIEEETTAAE